MADLNTYYTSFEFAKYGTEKKLKQGQKEIHNWEFYTSGTFLDYISRSDAIYIQDDNETSFQLKQSFINSSLSFKDWYSSRSKANRKSAKSGVYALFNDAKDINIDDMKQQLANINKKQNVWEMIINIGKDGEELFFVDKNKWASVLNKTFPRLLKKNDLSSSNINGYWAIHCNTGNPHIHINFWEKNPSILKGDEYIYKPKGAFSKTSIKQFEYIFKAEILSNAKWEETTFNKLEDIRNHKNEIWDKRKEIRNELKNSLNQMSDEIKCLNRAKAIKEELNNKDNKTFANLSDNNKENVLKIFEFLMNTNTQFKDMVAKYKQELTNIDNSQDNDFFKKYVDDFITKENDEFMQQIGNIICKSIDAMEENKEFYDFYIPKKRKSQLDWLIKRWEWEANKILWIKEQQGLRRFEKEVLSK
ncbi:hypothetical protein [Mycoplasma sp. Z1473D]